jgi:UDP-N-acetylglucosamine--N-acetylmuramyl-(pentapeptide) pyrophosphoryl-undecaprenol N-acetylglucosamine transferase
LQLQRSQKHSDVSMTDSSQPRTVIFAGGGTGGHLFPGIAVAQELLRQDAETRVLFIGSEKPIERDIVGRAGFEHVALPSVSPSFALTRIVPSLLKNWRAYRQARTILAREMPSVIVGLGGFASVPPVLAARRAGIPIVLLEQNVVPGKATRWLSRFANVVCLPWAETAGGLPKSTKTIVTGNPIRQEIAMLASEPRCRTGTLARRMPEAIREAEFREGAAPAEPCFPAVRGSAGASPSHFSDSLSGDGQECPSYKNLLILGGSQGATTLNGFVLKALEELVSQLAGWRIIHQTGASDLDAIRQRYADLKVNADVQPFLHDMAEQYRRATIVISRAGATTLAELACAGLPSILVPLPTSAHDHQRLNATLFADDNAAVLIVPQTTDAANVDALRTQLALLLNHEERRQQLRQAVRQFAMPNAAAAVITAISNLTKLR